MGTIVIALAVVGFCVIMEVLIVRAVGRIQRRHHRPKLRWK